MNNMWLLADATQNTGGGTEVITMEDSSGSENAVTVENGANGTATEEPQKQPQGMNPIMFIMIPLLLVYMFFIFRGPKKKQQEHKKMVSSLSKNDRVRTVGGIYGTVLDVRDDEIVLKIDESTNAKMRVSPQAIATVLTDKTE